MAKLDVEACCLPVVRQLKRACFLMHAAPLPAGRRTNPLSQGSRPRGSHTHEARKVVPQAADSERRLRPPPLGTDAEVDLVAMDG